MTVLYFICLLSAWGPYGLPGGQQVIVYKVVDSKLNFNNNIISFSLFIIY